MLTEKISANTEWVKSNQSLITEREKNIFNLGKEHEAQRAKKIRLDMLEANFAKSYVDTTKVLKKLKKDKIDVISARLKVENLNCLKIMLSVKNTGDTPLNLSNVYDFIFEIEEKRRSKNYRVNFSITKANESFSEDRVESDGYIYTHGLLDEESSRTA